MSTSSRPPDRREGHAASRAVRVDGHTRNYPLDCWYVAATGDEVGRRLLARTLLDRRIVLRRTDAGDVIAFEDRCPHRGYPLSQGTVQRDEVVCGYHGFAFGPTGACVRVPSQSALPYGAALSMLAVRERGPYVWVWLGNRSRSGLRSPEEVPWLSDDAVTVFGGQLEIAANYLLLHENLADVTHVPFVHPEVSPAVLRAAAPPLDVRVSEASVHYQRDYPPAGLADWHLHATGLPPAGQYQERESGSFRSPGLWVDDWEVLATADGIVPHTYSLRFAQAVTPVAPDRSRLVWHVGRNFRTADAGVTASLRALFGEYYERVARVAETLQGTIAEMGPRPMFNVSADAAALQVRRIIAMMLAEESGPRRI